MKRQRWAVVADILVGFGSRSDPPGTTPRSRPPTKTIFNIELTLPNGDLGQRSKEIISALDSWAGRTSTRRAILKVTPNPVPVLITIANSEQDVELCKYHALELLATFKGMESEQALSQVTDDRNPKMHCSSIAREAESLGCTSRSHKEAE